MVRKLAFLYILVVIVFFYGFAVARFKVPPYRFLESRIQELSAFVAGDTLDRNTTLLEKIENDTGLVPHRWIRKYPRTASRLGSYHTLETPGLKSRRDQPDIFIDDRHTSGYRAIFGALDFEDTFWGGLLINPDGKIVHTWHLSTEHLPGNEEADYNKNLYGINVDPDGSVTFSMQEAGGGIVKVDVCSNELWNLPGRYHHTVTHGDDGTFWSFKGHQATLNQDLVQVSSETGKILKTIRMVDVRRNNPKVHIWDLTYRSHEGIAEDLKRFNTGHLSHGNDIDPLPASLADSFEQFDAGDLLISYAATNLIFILDPESLEIKWWRIGVSDAQHDPDWEKDGRISIFDNEFRAPIFNMYDRGNKAKNPGFSQIVAVDPKTYEHDVIFDGGALKFSSYANGMHQRTVYDSWMITSATQGWVFEVDDAGKTVFSFINTYDGEKFQSLHLSDALRYPPDYFIGKPWEGC